MSLLVYSFCRRMGTDSHQLSIRNPSFLTSTSDFSRVPLSKQRKLLFGSLLTCSHHPKTYPTRLSLLHNKPCFNHTIKVLDAIIDSEVLRVRFCFCWTAILPTHSSHSSHSSTCGASKGKLSK